MCSQLSQKSERKTKIQIKVKIENGKWVGFSKFP